MRKQPALRCATAPWLDLVHVTGMTLNAPAPPPLHHCRELPAGRPLNHSQRREQPPACSEGEAASLCTLLTFKM